MIIVQVMRAKFGGKPALPTPQEIEDYYNAHPEKWRARDMLQISTITIPKASRESGTTDNSQQKQLAEGVRTQLETGADFAELARKYSQDRHGPDGGKWDWMESQSMNAIVAEAAHALKPGESSPVIEDKTAYIIVRLDAIKPSPTAPTLEKVRGEIGRLMAAERSQTQFRKWMDGVKQNAQIHKTP
jgi:parvulin-like peptidyl-prolyl isomerase